MMQGVQIEGQYIGQIQNLQNGQWRAWSEPVAMGELFPSYTSALIWLVETAKACGIDGTVRTPEHRMVF